MADILNPLPVAVVDLPLRDEEKILWTGRPAPRAYTFRNWRHALFGLVLTLPCILWQMAGIELARSGSPSWVAWLPLPFNLGALYLAFGQILLARLEWEKVFYVMSSHALYQQRGLFRLQLKSLPLEDICGVKKKSFGTNLASLRIESKGGDFLLFAMIEYPELLLNLLPHSELLSPSLPTPSTKTVSE